MLNIKEIIEECISYESEREWFEFKENWFEKDQIGEYISSLSNSATILGRDYAYLIWGIYNSNHKIVGTTINYGIDVNNEPLKHYLARNLSSSINFYFLETHMNDKRVVVLVIPS